MVKLEIDDNDITISRSWEEINVLIENSSDNITINMTYEEAKGLLYALQKTILEG